MPMVGVVVSEKERKIFEEFAEENSLSLSSAVRMLALKQLRYLDWEARGKPRRKQAKKEEQEVARMEPPTVPSR